MVEFATRDDLQRFSGNMRLDERVRLRKAAAAVAPSGATFLSHSSKDEDLVVGAIELLRNHGATVYVDTVDPAMPPTTNKETAAVLKRRIGQARRFVLLASENSKASTWVPWELGIADGCKGMSHIALFPAVDLGRDAQWRSWEYMGLYNCIVWGGLQGREGNLWMVWDQVQNSATELSEWLRV
jgi:hypothetical protein